MILSKISIIFPYYKQSRYLDAYLESVVSQTCSDWEFWINIIYNGFDKVYRLDATEFFYRRKEASRDTEINKDTLKTNKMHSYIIKKHSNIYAQHIFNDYHSFQKIKYHKEKYDELIFNNIFGRIYFKLAKLLSKKS